MQLTGRGLHVIKQFEGFMPTAYMDGFKPDGSKILSIGFGCSTLSGLFDIKEDSVWSEEFAHSELIRGLDIYGEALKPHLQIPVPDEIWSICLSLVWNKGVDRLVKSEPWEILHTPREDKRHLEYFCQSILNYATFAVNKQTGELEFKPGLFWRRIAEAALFFQDRRKGYAL
jgi:GH24 family phage-related lysozyme (muramidase)